MLNKEKCRKLKEWGLRQDECLEFYGKDRNPHDGSIWWRHFDANALYDHYRTGRAFSGGGLGPSEDELEEARHITSGEVYNTHSSISGNDSYFKIPNMKDLFHYAEKCGIIHIGTHFVFKIYSYPASSKNDRKYFTSIDGVDGMKADTPELALYNLIARLKGEEVK